MNPAFPPTNNHKVNFCQYVNRIYTSLAPSYAFCPQAQLNAIRDIPLQLELLTDENLVTNASQLLHALPLLMSSLDVPQRPQ